MPVFTAISRLKYVCGRAFFVWFQIAVRVGFPPGTCVYSNLETKTLLQQSRGLKCYSNMDTLLV